jgi:hypothetical protein
MPATGAYKESAAAVGNRLHALNAKKDHFPPRFASRNLTSGPGRELSSIEIQHSIDQAVMTSEKGRWTC